MTDPSFPLPELDPTGVEVITEVPPAPDDGPENDDRVELVRTGLVRLWTNGQRYRLRRPFFGELRELRMSLAEVLDEIMTASLEAQEDAERLRSQAETAQNLQPEDRLAALKEIRSEDRAISRRITDQGDDLRLGWWQRVFEKLSLDGSPPDEQWPAWLLDPLLPGRVVQHWRSVPLARGG